MSKGPPQLPSNPFARTDNFGAPPAARSATGGFSDGVKVNAPSFKVSPQDVVDAPKHNDPNVKLAQEKAKIAGKTNGAPGQEDRSAVAGFDQGGPASTKALESGDFPAAKKNPFDRKPKSLKPEATQVSSIKQPAAKVESPFEKKPDGPNIVTTSGGLEVTQVKAQSPDEYTQRLKEAQKPVEIKEVNANNYMKAYELQEKERAETKQAEIKQAQEIKKAEESTKVSFEDQSRLAAEAQVQMAKNAALANQARELQARMALLRGQLGQGNDAGINASIEECRVQLAQIPTGLQG